MKIHDVLSRAITEPPSNNVLSSSFDGLSLFFSCLGKKSKGKKEKRENVKERERMNEEQRTRESKRKKREREKCESKKWSGKRRLVVF